MQGISIGKHTGPRRDKARLRHDQQVYGGTEPLSKRKLAMGMVVTGGSLMRDAGGRQDCMNAAPPRDASGTPALGASAN